MRLSRDNRNIPLAEDTNVYFFTSMNIVSNKKYKDTSKHTTPHHNTPQQGKAVQNTFPLWRSDEMQSLSSIFNENQFCPTLLTFSNIFFLPLQIIISSDWYVTYECCQWHQIYLSFMFFHLYPHFLTSAFTSAFPSSLDPVPISNLSPLIFAKMMNIYISLCSQLVNPLDFICPLAWQYTAMRNSFKWRSHISYP